MHKHLPTVAYRGKLSSALGCGRALPFGSALIHFLQEPALESLCAALEASMDAPWCPVILAVATAAMATVAERLVETLRWRAVVLVHHEGESLLFPRIEAVIAGRCVPNRAAVVRYVAERSGPALGALVARATEGRQTWNSALRRQLCGCGAQSPQHWFNLLRLAKLLHSADSRSAPSLEAAALEVGMAPRTLSGWCAKYLRCSWPEARSRLGWEWMVETMLSQISAPPIATLPTRGASLRKLPLQPSIGLP